MSVLTPFVFDAGAAVCWSIILRDLHRTMVWQSRGGYEKLRIKVPPDVIQDVFCALLN